ncbi:amidohydrolase family protein [Campylobacter sp. RM12647]|uniref:amidohydrolase family protein n=1 Tax=Campylobacter sp. RM12647 TaxID=2735737 RepID=UPI001E0D4C7C|nr:amidohydrolase family protein [Campylobacter sp. RM12647]
MKIIDTHFHIWDKNDISWVQNAPTRLQRDFSFDEYLDEFSKSDFLGGVYVEINANNPSQESAKILSFKHKKLLALCLATIGGASFREVLHTKPSGYCLGSEFKKTINLVNANDLMFEVCINEDELSNFSKIAKEFKSGIIFNHFANIKDFSGEDSLRQIAKKENIYMKLSCQDDFILGKDYSKLLDMAFNIFGESRICFGSNYPVSELKPNEWIRIIENHFKSDDLKEKIFYLNAKEIYKIKEI